MAQPLHAARIACAIAAGQFHDRPGAKTPGNAIGSHVFNTFQTTQILVEKYGVDGISQAKRMYCLAGPEPQAAMSGQFGIGMQSTQPVAITERRENMQWFKLGIQIPTPTILTTIGKPIIRKVQGKMQNTIGNSIFTGASRASFSARKNLSALRCSDCARNNGPKLMPS